MDISYGGFKRKNGKTCMDTLACGGGQVITVKLLSKDNSDF